jgi:hypothetical protein
MDMEKMLTVPRLAESSWKFKDSFPKEKKSFAFRLYHLLNDITVSNVICWLPEGDGFFIPDIPRFTSELAPVYFKHNKLASFQRQLNLYGFRRYHDAGVPSSYFHVNFRRGREDLLDQVQRFSLPDPYRIPRARKSEFLSSFPTQVPFVPQLSLFNSNKSCKRTYDDMSEISSEHSIRSPTGVASLSPASSFDEFEKLDTFAKMEVVEPNQPLFYYRQSVNGTVRFVPCSPPVKPELVRELKRIRGMKCHGRKRFSPSSEVISRSSTPLFGERVVDFDCYVSNKRANAGQDGNVFPDDFLEPWLDTRDEDLACLKDLFDPSTF